MEWSKEEITALKKAIKKTSAVEDKNQRWKDIANLVGNGKTKKYCYLKYKELKQEQANAAARKASPRRQRSVDEKASEVDKDKSVTTKEDAKLAIATDTDKMLSPVDVSASPGAAFVVARRTAVPEIKSVQSSSDMLEVEDCEDMGVLLEQPVAGGSRINRASNGTSDVVSNTTKSLAASDIAAVQQLLFGASKKTFSSHWEEQVGIVLYVVKRWASLEFPIKSEHYGLVQFVISVLLTKGVDTIKGEMDQLMGGQLIGAHDYCTQDIVNLLLCGYACSNVFNGEQVLEGGSSEDTIVLRGVSSQSAVGFLSLFEAYQNLVPFGMEPALLRLHLVLTAMAVGYGVIFLLCVWIVVYMRHHRSDFAYLKLQRKIGAGASAVVFQGILHSKIPVAIKVYTPRMLSEETVAEFSHEAALCDYMAPELIEGKAGTAVYGEAADIYSLAITLWDIVNPLGSKYPEANRSHLQVFDSVLVGERPPLGPSMHPELRRLLTEAWHQQPERRPSATYILTALETLQQEVGAHTALGLASVVERTDDSCIVSGQLLIQHMLKLNFVDSTAEACRVGNSLMCAGFLHHVHHQESFRKPTEQFYFDTDVLDVAHVRFESIWGSSRSSRSSIVII
ncbi:hypothetical protein BBJ29_006595 [Phytophthora kernoviae]|uniref:Myb-like domain-containing protein n=1 Tax=Phytophthora kernoviae TaxID=325452 RepID=A0A3F2RY19_9STRA|nr:hypothetical protein BBJ29_006595 [Phytophthora kernoviae]RLN65561.1 hypothetical protein BBP00_00002775 [Phytophthora kernoviae]